MVNGHDWCPTSFLGHHYYDYTQDGHVTVYSRLLVPHQPRWTPMTRVRDCWVPHPGLWTSSVSLSILIIIIILFSHQILKRPVLQNHWQKLKSSSSSKLLTKQLTNSAQRKLSPGGSKFTTWRTVPPSPGRWWSCWSCGGGVQGALDRHDYTRAIYGPDRYASSVT